MTNTYCKNRWFSMPLFLAVIILTISCGKKGPQQLPPPEVDVTSVIKDKVEITDEFVGQTFGYKDIAIRARVDGFLEGIHFVEGTLVKKGQLLYTIDPQPYEAKVAEALGGLAEAKTRLVQTKNDLERYKPLAEINAVSKKDLDAAEANYGASQAAVEAAEAALKSARIQLGYTKIYSPINGVIGRTLAKEGDYVGKSPNPVVLNGVSDTDIILVQFSLSEKTYLQLARYARANRNMNMKRDEREYNLELILSDGTKHDHLGRLDFIDRSVDPTTGTVILQASFDNPDRIIKPGQFAKVRAVVEDFDNALLIPQRSVTELQGKYFVYLIDNENKINIKEVQLFENMGDMVIVREGLSVGDKIIVSGLQSVREGMQVRVNEVEFASKNKQ